MQEITDAMNLKGVRTKKGDKISINSVTRMLHNRRYSGEYKYRDVIQPNGVPAIVPTELFERVQERMAANKKAPAKHKADDEYLLTTKLFYAKCECMMAGESGTSHTGQVHRYYKCVSVKYHRGYKKKTVKKDFIESVVIEELKAFLDNDELVDAVAHKVLERLGAENTVLPLLCKQYAEVEKSISNLLYAMEQGIITPSTKERPEALEAQKRDLFVQITKEEMSRPSLTYEKLLLWFQRFRKLDMTKPEHRRRLTDTFLNSVLLDDDRMVICFNYQLGAKTITLADIQMSALGSDLSAANARKKDSTSAIPNY